jgi:hypothetical protein
MAVDDDGADPYDRAADRLGRDAVHGARVLKAEVARGLAAEPRRHGPVRLQDDRCVADGEDQVEVVDDGGHRPKPEVEPGHDPEVAATTAEAPEQLGV